MLLSDLIRVLAFCMISTLFMLLLYSILRPYGVTGVAEIRRVVENSLVDKTALSLQDKSRTVAFIRDDEVAAKYAESGLDVQNSLGVWPYVKRDRYPKRVNMSECVPRYGKIGIFIATDDNVKQAYHVALKSLECYLKSTPYQYFLVNAANDPEVLKFCSQYKTVQFRKHCAAALYLPKVDWLFILDADTGVVNPNHCIEEFIDTRANIILYERAYDWEIMVGNYMVRNNKMGRDFLMEIADGEKYDYFGSDQGPLPNAIMKLVIPAATHEREVCFNIWKTINHSESSDTKARDSNFNEDNWNEDIDFFIHNWKLSAIDEKWASPFKTIPDPAKCGRSFDGWDWRPEKKVSVEKLRQQMEQYEQKQQAWFPNASRGLAYLLYADIGDCWPHCEDKEE